MMVMACNGKRTEKWQERVKGEESTQQEHQGKTDHDKVNPSARQHQLQLQEISFVSHPDSYGFLQIPTVLYFNNGGV